jgi:hypothetical protein
LHRLAGDLRCYLAWCAQHGLDPLAAQRPHLELYIRWMQQIRRFKPSTVSRRFPVTAGFYRTCALDGIVQHSPAGHVRRPVVPPNHPRPGSRTCSPGPCSPPPGNHRTGTISRWWRCSGCWACGPSKPPERTSPTSARSTATGCCGSAARAPRSCWYRCRQAVGRAIDRAVSSRARHPSQFPPVSPVATRAGADVLAKHPCRPGAVLDITGTGAKRAARPRSGRFLLVGKGSRAGRR